MLIAHWISESVTDMRPPQWPQPFTSSWHPWVEILAKSDCAPVDLERYRRFWCAVTEGECVAAGNVATLLRAWRDMLDLAADVPERQHAVDKIRRQLEYAWSIKLAAPPRHAHIEVAAQRLTRRYDLLPREARELGAA